MRIENNRGDLPADTSGTASTRFIRGRAHPERTLTGPIRSAHESILLQPWITLYMDSSIEQVIQPASDWLDTIHSRYTLLIDLREITYSIGTTEYRLLLETSNDAGGPWRQVGPDFTALGTHNLLLSGDASSPYDSFDRYIRWSADFLSGTQTDWRLCFQIKAVPGTQAFPAAQTILRRK